MPFLARWFIALIFYAIWIYLHHKLLPFDTNIIVNFAIYVLCFNYVTTISDEMRKIEEKEQNDE